MRLHVPTPLAVVSTSEAVLSGGAGGTGEQLVTALRAHIEASEVAVGPRTIPIEIADGAAKLALVTLDSQAGTTKVETTVDLASLVVDSAWIVEPRAPDVPQADKPRGEWNTFEITMKADRLWVKLNGVEVIADAELPGVASDGPIALQHHGNWDAKRMAWSGPPSLVQFRNIYIQELK